MNDPQLLRIQPPASGAHAGTLLPIVLHDSSKIEHAQYTGAAKSLCVCYIYKVIGNVTCTGQIHAKRCQIASALSLEL